MARISAEGGEVDAAELAGRPIAAGFGMPAGDQWFIGCVVPAYDTSNGASMRSGQFPSNGGSLLRRASRPGAYEVAVVPVPSVPAPGSSAAAMPSCERIWLSRAWASVSICACSTSSMRDSTVAPWSSEVPSALA